MPLPSSVVLNDENGLLRAVFNDIEKTIVNGSPTTLFNAECLAGKVCAGVIHTAIYATDGTDYQALTGIVTYAAVNKAGTLTLTITNATGNDAKAVSTGTLTLSWTIVANAGNNGALIKLQPSTSLTATKFTVKYSVYPVHGRVDIL